MDFEPDLFNLSGEVLNKGIEYQHRFWENEGRSCQVSKKTLPVSFSFSSFSL
jgi:hypothetical protein